MADLLRASDLSRLLAARIMPLTAELLPAGQREGNEWRAGDFSGEKGRKLAVCLSGDRAGSWINHASGEGGDALSLVAQARYSGDIRSAMDWARRWLGISEKSPPAAVKPSPPAVPLGEDPDQARRRMRAAAILARAARGLAGTPAEAYLAGRAIHLADVGRQPGALRFHAGLHNAESGRAWPAMVAGIVDPASRHVATHRTWLAQSEDGRWTKAPLLVPRSTLGAYAGGCIRLWRGASGRPLASATADEEIVIGEGIETCLSAIIACPERRVLCAVSISNMGKLWLPPQVRRVLLLSDGDASDSAAGRGLARAVDHFSRQGRQVRIALSPIGGDLNDLLQADADDETE
jgi:hypothetical protein